MRKKPQHDSAVFHYDWQMQSSLEQESLREAFAALYLAEISCASDCEFRLVSEGNQFQLAPFEKHKVDEATVGICVPIRSTISFDKLIQIVVNNLELAKHLAPYSEMMYQEHG